MGGMAGRKENYERLRTAFCAKCRKSQSWVMLRYCFGGKSDFFPKCSGKIGTSEKDNDSSWGELKRGEERGRGSRKCAGCHLGGL